MTAPVLCSTSSCPSPQPASFGSNGNESGRDERSGFESKAGGEAGTSSTCGAAFNIFCAVVGTGMLQQAYGAAQTGWVVAWAMLAMGVLACYTAMLAMGVLA